MKANQVLHETIVMERTYGAGIDRVFAAFADPEARSKWSVPSDTAVLIYDEANFATGRARSFQMRLQERSQISWRDPLLAYCSSETHRFIRDYRCGWQTFVSFTRHCAIHGQRIKDQIYADSPGRGF